MPASKGIATMSTEPTAQAANRTDEAHLIDLRRAFVAVSPSAAPRADCPPAGQIWEGVRGELAPVVLRQIIHHVASCSLCTEAWRLAEKLEENPAPSLSSRVGWWRSTATAMAAAAVLVLAVGLSLRDAGPAATPPAFRAPGGDEIELLSAGPLPREDCVLRWRGPDTADYYQLRVVSAVDPLHPLVEETRIEATEYRVPEDVLSGLAPDTTLLIHLEAVDPTAGPPAITATVVVR